MSNSTLQKFFAHNSDLKVIARTSSFAFKGKNEDMRAIAAKLGVVSENIVLGNGSNDVLELVARARADRERLRLAAERAAWR